MSSYEMYSDDGDAAVAAAVDELVARITAGDVRRVELPHAVQELCKAIDRTFPEVYDTEPQYHIAQTLSAACVAQGWLPIERGEW